MEATGCRYNPPDDSKTLLKLVYPILFLVDVLSWNFLCCLGVCMATLLGRILYIFKCTMLQSGLLSSSLKILIYKRIAMDQLAVKQYVGLW